MPGSDGVEYWYFLRSVVNGSPGFLLAGSGMLVETAMV